MRYSRRVGWVFALVLAAALTASGSLARAQVAGDALAAQSDRIREAAAAERAADPARALELYRAARELAPGSRLARRAEQRIAWLEARSAGGFEPLRELVRMQQVPARELDPATLAAFERRVAGFPEGRVRVEARWLAAESWLALKRWDEAARAYRALLDEPLAAHERRTATLGLARALRARGDVGEALSVLEAAGLGRAPLADELRREASRRIGRPIAWAAIVVFVACALALGGWRGLRPAVVARAVSPSRLAATAWALAVPLAIATLYDAATTDTFAVAAGGFAGVLLVASIAGVGLEASRAPRRLRVAVAVLAVLAQLAVGYLVLDLSGLTLTIDA